MLLAKKIGVSFAVTHLLAFILFTLYLWLATEGETRLLWALWLPLDFPVSLAVIMGFDFVSPDSQIGSFTRTWLPYFVHGIFGTIWWYLIPIMAGRILHQFINKKHTHKNRIRKNRVSP